MFLLSGVLLALACPAAPAASVWWDGSSGTSWNTPENWSATVEGGVTPLAVPSRTDDVFFNATAAPRPISTLGAAQSANGVTFRNNSTQALMLTGYSLTLGPGGITVRPGAAAHTIASAITLDAPQTWANNGEGLLTIGGAVANYSRLLTIGGSGPVILSGILGGSGGLVKTGDGKLVLSGANPFKGALTVRNGLLSVPKINNADAKGPLGKSAGPVTLGGSGTSGTLEYTGPSASSTKPFAVPARGVGVFRVKSAGCTLTLNGTVAGGGEWIKAGKGGLILSHPANALGGVTVKEGALTLLAGGAGNLTVRGGLCRLGAGARVSTTRIAGGTVAYNSAWPHGSAILTAGAVTFGAGSGVSTADFSFARGTAAATNGLVIGSRLILEDGLSISTAEGGAFTIEGGSISGRDAVRTLTITGGTLRLSAPGVLPGLDIRAWQNDPAPGDIDGPRFGLSSPPDPAPTHSTFAGTLGYATEAIAMGNGDQEHWGDGNSGGIPDGHPWRPAGFADQYTVEYRGRLLTGAGVCRFATASDDGSALWLDPATDNPAYEDALVQNNNWQSLTRRESGPVELTAGFHDILIRFYEGGGENALQVLWDPAGGEDFTAIPGAAFFHGSGTTAVILSNTTFALSAPAGLDLGGGEARHALGRLNLSGPDTVAGITNANHVALGGLTVDIAAAGPPGRVVPKMGTLDVSGATLAFTGSASFASPFTLVHCTGDAQVAGVFKSASGAVLADGAILDVNGVACRIAYAGEGRVTEVTLSRLDGFMLEIR